MKLPLPIGLCQRNPQEQLGPAAGDPGAGPVAMLAPALDNRRCTMEGIIGVTARIVAIERRAVVVVQWRRDAQSLRQIRIGDKQAPERDEIGVACFNDALRAIRSKATRRDERAFEDATQVSSRGRRGDVIVNAHSRLDCMRIREPIGIQTTRDIAERGMRIAIGHRAVRASGRKTHRDVAGVPNRTDGIEHLEQEARAV